MPTDWFVKGRSAVVRKPAAATPASGSGAAWSNTWTDVGDFTPQTISLEAGQTVGLIAAIDGFFGDMQVLVNGSPVGPLWQSNTGGGLRSFGCQFTASSTGSYIFDLDPGGSVDENGNWIIVLATPNTPVSPPLQFAGGFSNLISDAPTTTDPPMGASSILGTGWAGLTMDIDVSTPTEITSSGPSSFGYLGWAKLVLTGSTTIAFDTFGSGMQDTVLWLYDEVPTLTSVAIDMNDDSNDTANTTGTWSSISNGAPTTPLVLAAGTYYIALFPYSGDSWDTGEGDPVLNLTVS